MATTSVRLDQDLVEKATIMGKALNRTMPKQIEHWAKIGEMMDKLEDLELLAIAKERLSEDSVLVNIDDL